MNKYFIITDTKINPCEIELVVVIKCFFPSTSSLSKYIENIIVCTGYIGCASVIHTGESVTAKRPGSHAGQGKHYLVCHYAF